MTLRLNGSTSGYTEIDAPATASNNLLTLPNANSTLVSASGMSGTLDFSGATVRGAGLDLITSNTFSAQTTLSFNNCFTSTYENYRLVVSGTFTTSSLDMWLRFRSGGVDNSTANYVTSTGLITSSSTYVAQHAGSWTRIQTYTTTSFTDGFLVDWTIARPQLNTKTEVTGFTNRGSMEWQGASYVAAASFDGFSLIFGSSFTGTVRVYGYRN